MDAVERGRRAAALTSEQLAAVIEQLNRGYSLRRACKAAGVNPSDLRWLRSGDAGVAGRVDAARVRGLLGRASRLKDAAARLEKRAAAI